MDPLASDYAAWSPYNYILDNPIRFTDPDGRGVEGIGVNSNGRVVYDDGKDDGNLYYFGDYDGEQFSSLEEVTARGVEYQTAVEGYQLKDQEALNNFVYANFRAVAPRNAEAINNSIGAIELTADPQYKMQTETSNPLVRQKDGSFIALQKDPGEFILRISAANSNVIDDIGLFQSTLAHESVHFIQGFKNKGKSLMFKNASEYRKRAIIDELEAYDFQVKHWTWDDHPAKHEVRKAMKRFRSSLK